MELTLSVKRCDDGQILDERSLDIEELRKSIFDGVVIEIEFGQIEKQVLVASFGFHVVVVEILQLLIFHRVGDDAEALATTGLHHAGDEKSIQQSIITTTSYLGNQTTDIRIFGIGTSCRPRADSISKTS